MNRIPSHLVVVFASALLMSACGNKTQTKDIIVNKPASTRQNTPEKMQNYQNTRDIQWLGAKYKIYVHRFVDVSLPLAEDESGRKYYDNKIELKVLRADGSEFFARTFSKKDFDNAIDDNYKKNGALLGLAFMDADGDNLKFGGSVGSPDNLSDEYIPVVVTIGRTGSVSIKRDTQLDTNSDADHQDTEDDSETE
jgi:hypothetical protein